MPVLHLPLSATIPHRRPRPLQMLATWLKARFVAALDAPLRPW